ncbi:hypothetical protein OTU49_008755, partial [Cherax quadricarinatus]
MELVTGRSGLRSGRAVVGLDVVTNTLPRSSTHQCCPPSPPLSLRTHEDSCSDCQGCQSQILPPGSPFLSYPAHLYPSVVASGWGVGGGVGECTTCSLIPPPPCACPDPRCVGAAPPPCSWTYLHHQHQGHDAHVDHHAHAAHGLDLPRASSVCSLPKLLSVEERLTAALGRVPDSHDHLISHAHGILPASSRLSRSLEDLPKDIKEHILKCQCSCDHLGYGNFSATSLHQLPGLSNGCSSLSTKTSSGDDLSPDLSHLRHKQKGVEVPAQVWGGVCLVLVLAGVAGVGVSIPLALRVAPQAALQQRIDTVVQLLRDTPLIDGHNDLPWNIRKFMHNKLHSFNFTAQLHKLRPWSRSSWSHTDLPRLRQGMVGAQFWVSYVPCESQTLNAVQLTIEQIDLIKRLINQYPQHLRLATTAHELEEAFREGLIASLIGVEGGHAIQNSLGVLRALRDLGVRYLTLTHTCSTPWAECARARETDLEDPESPRGLTHFGKTVVREMNRLGLLVDLSHVSQATMKAALEVSRAPVIFSHSSVYAICKNPRNVPDDILKKVAINGGVVMVSFYTHFLTCSETATIKDVVDHINHVRNIAGVEHVG